MSNYLALALAITVGACSSIQAAINSELGKQIGGVGAALVSFLVGAIIIVSLYIGTGEGGLTRITKTSPYLWIGGIMGAAFVYGMIKLIPVLGVGTFTAGAIAGQLLLALLIDQFGWFGVTKIGLDWTRGIGAVLLLIGVKLMSK